MTRDEAQHLIDSYCYDVPPDEEVAIKRLMQVDLADFDKLGEPGCAAQDQLDDLIYRGTYNMTNDEMQSAIAEGKLYKYGDNTEEPRPVTDLDDALDIHSEDPSLLYRGG